MINIQDWQSRITAREFINDMAGHVSMPEAYLKLRRLIEAPDTRIEDFVSVIQTDSMLSIRIIRMANSEFFGFSRQVENLDQAISLIGIMQLHDLLLCSLCMRAFASIPEQVLNLKAFWQYSVNCGIAARVIARHSTLTTSNHFFALGLLHEIGHLAMYTKAPGLSLKALEDSQTQNRSIDELEKTYLGFDYTQLGMSLMQLWHLPEVYQQVARHHLQPYLADNSHLLDVLIIHLAHISCQSSTQELQRDLIFNAAVNFPSLKQLPGNISDVINNEINAHGDDVLDMLWPFSSQISTELNWDIADE